MEAYSLDFVYLVLKPGSLTPDFRNVAPDMVGADQGQRQVLGLPSVQVLDRAHSGKRRRRRKLFGENVDVGTVGVGGPEVAER